MTTCKKYIANISATVWGIIGLVGTVVGILGLLATTYNWSSVMRAEFDFPKYESSVDSDWCSVSGTHEVAAWQTKGTSSCTYDCYRYTRNTSGYSKLFTNKTFAENDALDGIKYTVTFPQFNDTYFKVNKTIGTNVASLMVLGISNP